MSSTTIPTPMPISSGHEYPSSAGITQMPEEATRFEDMIVLESCHNTWIFDPVRLRFCRIVKGIRVAGRTVSTEWRPYWQLDLDSKTDAFAVYLNASRTRLIRSWRHTKNGRSCDSGPSGAATLEDAAGVISLGGMALKPANEGASRQPSTSDHASSHGPKRRPKQRERLDVTL